MRFLHPGQACAAKCASSAAELGWDGSLMHCKSRGQVVPSFGWTYGNSTVANQIPAVCHNPSAPKPLHFLFERVCFFDFQEQRNVNGLERGHTSRQAPLVLRFKAVSHGCIRVVFRRGFPYSVVSCMSPNPLIW